MPEPFLTMALGLSSLVILGGGLALFGAFLPPVLWAVLIIGLVASGPELARFFKGVGKGEILWLGLAMAAISFIGISRLYVVDPSDDEVAYFPLAADLLARGVADQPLSLRAALGFGGQTLLQAIFSLPGNIRYAAAYDWFLPACAILFSCAKNKEAFKESCAPILAAAFALFLLLPHGSWNSAPSFLAILPIGALAKLRFSHASVRVGIAAAFLIALAASLRVFWAVPAGLVFAVQCFSGGGWKSKDRLLCVGIAALGSTALLLPYIASQMLQFSTPSTLLLPGNVVPEYLKYPNANPMVGLAMVAAAATHPEAVGLLLCAVGLLCWKPEHTAAVIVLLAAFAFVAYQCGDLDANYAVRYGKPFLLAITAIAYLSVLGPRIASRSAAATVLIGSGCIWAAASLPALRNICQVATAAPLVTAYDNLDRAGVAAGGREMQERVPVGETILALNSFPRHLDYRRNPISLGDLPGTIRGLPISGKSDFYDACRKLGIRWIVASNPENDQGYRSEKFPHHELRFHQRRWLPDHRRFIELNKSIADDSVIRAKGGNCSKNTKGPSLNQKLLAKHGPNLM